MKERRLTEEEARQVESVVYVEGEELDGGIDPEQLAHKGSREGRSRVVPGAARCLPGYNGGRTPAVPTSSSSY
jgi:hypothetical protein